MGSEPPQKCLSSLRNEKEFALGTLHWEQREKGNMQGSRTGVGTVRRSTDVQQKFPLGPRCSVVFLSAILAGMSPSLFAQNFNLLLKLIWMFLGKPAFSGLGTAYFD